MKSLNELVLHNLTKTVKASIEVDDRRGPSNVLDLALLTIHAFTLVALPYKPWSQCGSVSVDDAAGDR